MAEELYDEFKDEELEVIEDDDVRDIRKTSIFRRIYSDEVTDKKLIGSKDLLEYDRWMSKQEADYELELMKIENEKLYREAELDIRRDEVKFNKKNETIKTVVSTVATSTIVGATLYEMKTNTSLFSDAWKSLRSKFRF